MGEWIKEPDHIEFEENGFRALILRNPTFGHLNGYLAIPMNYVLHGIDNIPHEIPSHKGWTYTSDLHPATGEEDEDWWIGFDCCHAGDKLPFQVNLTEIQLHEYMPVAQYRNVEYVRDMLKEAAVNVRDYMGPNIAIFRA